MQTRPCSCRDGGRHLTAGAVRRSGANGPAGGDAGRDASTSLSCLLQGTAPCWLLNPGGPAQPYTARPYLAWPSAIFAWSSRRLMEPVSTGPVPGPALGVDCASMGAGPQEQARPRSPAGRPLPGGAAASRGDADRRGGCRCALRRRPSPKSPGKAPGGPRINRRRRRPLWVSPLIGDAGLARAPREASPLLDIPP